MTINSMIEDYGEDTFMGLDMTKLDMDQAYLEIHSTYDTIYLYGLSDACVECPYTKMLGPLYGTTITKLSTRFHTAYRLFSADMGPQVLKNTATDSYICEVNDSLGEFGVYQLVANETNCELTTLKEPVNIYLPILTVFLIYLVLLVIPISSCLKRYFFARNNSQNSAPEVTEKRRLQSLDTFRGISIVLMIFVNYGGGGYVFMDHAIWNGLQVADLVFPWFMWIMGVCIPMSIKSIHKRKIPKMKAFLNILRRSCILFAIGIFLGSGTSLSKLRIFGVLQRFGICYFVVATLSLFIVDQEIQETQVRWKRAILDLRISSKLGFVAFLIFAVHSLLIFLVSIEGCPKGYLGPGGYHKNGEFFNCTGGVTGYLDDVVLGNHVYQYPTIKEVYKSQAFDPEGILGCLTSIIQVIIGLQAGVILLTFKSHKARILRWFLWGAFTGLIGGALCNFSKEGGAIPLNKNLWSLSFVLVTSSLAFFLLVVCYVLIDVKNIWSGKPFLFAGMNAIIMYIGHSMTYSNFPVRWQIDNHSTHFIHLFENVWGTLFWIFVAFILYKKKQFLSI